MRPDLTFQVVFLKDGTTVASPTVLAEFGREVRLEVVDQMRVIAMAGEPDEEGRSFVSAKLFTHTDEGWTAAREMTSNRMLLSATPSFECSVEGTPYRFVVMPRIIVPAANDG